MKTLLQDRLSGLYFKAIGHWVKDPAAAFSFRSCGRAVEFCLSQTLWGTRVILMCESDSQAVVVTLEEPVNQHTTGILARSG